jgi:hypothetical protein
MSQHEHSLSQNNSTLMVPDFGTFYPEQACMPRARVVVGDASGTSETSKGPGSRSSVIICFLVFS